MSQPARVVKCGSVSIRVYRRADGAFRFAWKDTRGAWRYSTFRSEKKALDAARDRALRIAQGETVEAVSAAELAEFRAWKAARGLESRSVRAAVEEYLEAKEAAAGLSDRHVRDVRGRLLPMVEALGDVPVGAVAPADLFGLVFRPEWSARSRKNVRGVLVAFFRWCRLRGYLPDGPTAPERLEAPKVPRRPLEFFSPAEFRVVLEAVRPEYLPAVVLGGFCGLRSQELRPPTSGRKPPLDWSAVDLARGLVVVPADVAKTGRRRIVPIPPAAADWLSPVALAAGPILPRTGFSAHESGRLGAILGRWPKNGLRHSFGVYRAAVTQNLGQVALEMGNSAAVVQACYWEAVPEEEGREWFGNGPRIVERSGWGPDKT